MALVAAQTVVSVTVNSPQVSSPVAEAIAQAKLKLAPHVTFELQTHRGQTSVVIHEPTQNLYFKASLAIRTLLLKLNGATTLRDLAQQHPHLDSFVNTQQGVDLLLQLLEAKVLLSDLPLDLQREIQQSRANTRRARRMRWMKPWLIKVPLFNPDSWLARANEVCGFLWSKPIFGLWLLLITSAAALAQSHWSELAEYWQSRFADPFNILLMVLIYPVLKALHELAHGLTCKRWGGHVFEMGVLFLFFVPVPYVDASASVYFREKHQRMLVAAVGVMVELACASVALIVWFAADSTLVKDIAINVMLIGAVSSVFFNGNPLLKFDGYYVLSDWLEIPNLSQRANNYIGAQVKSAAFGLKSKPVQYRAGERKWLLGYGVIAGCYRLFVTIAITLFIANHYFFIGTALAILAVFSQLLWPSYKAITSTWREAQQQRRQLRFVGALSVLLLAVWVGLFEVPVGRTTSAAGILAIAPDRQLKAQTDGFLTGVYAQHGDSVTAGQPLLELTNTSLRSELRFLNGRIIETQTLLNQFLTEDPVQAAIYREELTTLEQELGDLEHELQGLRLYAGVSGKLEMPIQNQMLGRFFKKGDLIASINNGSAQTALVVVQESDSAAIAEGVEAIRVKLHAYPEWVFPGSLASMAPVMTRQLPSRFLGSGFGGYIPVDSADGEGVQALASYFQYEITVPVQDWLLTQGARVSVKFVHDAQPFGVRLGLWLRQFVLQNLRS